MIEVVGLTNNRCRSSVFQFAARLAKQHMNQFAVESGIVRITVFEALVNNYDV